MRDWWVFGTQRKQSCHFRVLQSYLVFTEHSLLYELDQHAVSSSSKRIHFGNEQILLNQKTNVNTSLFIAFLFIGYSIFIFKKLCKVLGKIVPLSG